MPNWKRTLQLGQKAKDMGMRLTVTVSRHGDKEDEAKFQTLASSPQLAFFGKDEKELMLTFHKMLDDKKECEILFGDPEG